MVVAVLAIILSMGLLLSSNTIIGSELANGAPAKVGIAVSIVASCGLVVVGLARRTVGCREVGLWLVLLGVLAAIGCVVWFANAMPASRAQLSVLFIAAVAPLAWSSVRRMKLDALVLNALVGLTVFLAVSSLVLWLLGPVLELIKPMTSLKYSWAPGDGTGTKIMCYFFLLFNPQYLSVFDYDVARNSSVFVEAPIFAFVLTTAVLIELFLVGRKPRRGVLVLLFVAIVTTFSVTAYVVCAIALVIKAAPCLIRTFRGLPRVWRIVVVVLMFGIAMAGALAMARKTGSDSWAIRSDDYVAGFKAWIKSPVFGHGLQGDQAIRNQMSSFRINNTGMSNSVMQVLALGGIAFGLAFALGFAGFFVERQRARVSFGISFFVLWAATVVTFLPLALFVVGIGAGELLLWLCDRQFARTRAGHDVRGRRAPTFAPIAVVVLVCAVVGVATFAIAPILPVRFEAAVRANVYLNRRGVHSPYKVTSESTLADVGDILKTQRAFLMAAPSADERDQDGALVDAEVDGDQIAITCSTLSEQGAISIANSLAVEAKSVEWILRRGYSLDVVGATCRLTSPDRLRYAASAARATALIGAGVVLVAQSLSVRDKLEA